MILTVAQARALAEQSMQAIGHNAEEAAIVADHLIDCELRGLSFGGLPRVLSIAERAVADPDGRRPISILLDTPVSATLDGGEQVGYLVASRATDIAIEKAARSGLAIVGASKTWYTGMFSYYLERITAAGYVGMIAGSGGPRVAPHGGTQARYSTNPIAFGFPSAGGPPVIWDIGTASMMLGEVVLKQRLGQRLPEGRAYDALGEPTRDPGAALQGAFTVWGGHKGSGLALVVQMLGMLAGQQVNAAPLQDCGFLVLVIDPAVLGPEGRFARQVAEFVDTMHATRPVDPDQPVRVPFERSAQTREQRLREDAIQVEDVVYEALQRLVAKGSRAAAS